MKINVGKTDQFLRILLAVVVGILIGTGHLSGLPAIFLGAFAAIFVVTSIIGFLPAAFTNSIFNPEKG